MRQRFVTTLSVGSVDRFRRFRGSKVSKKENKKRFYTLTWKDRQRRLFFFFRRTSHTRGHTLWGPDPSSSISGGPPLPRVPPWVRSTSSTFTSISDTNRPSHVRVGSTGSRKSFPQILVQRYRIKDITGSPCKSRGEGVGKRREAPTPQYPQTRVTIVGTGSNLGSTTKERGSAFRIREEWKNKLLSFQTRKRTHQKHSFLRNERISLLEIGLRRLPDS